MFAYSAHVVCAQRRRVDALHFFLWRTSALNIPHKTKPDSFRPFRLRVEGALFPIGHSDRRHLEFSVLLIFFRSKTGKYRTTGTLLPACNYPYITTRLLVYSLRCQWTFIQTCQCPQCPQGHPLTPRIQPLYHDEKFAPILQLGIL